MEHVLTEKTITRRGHTGARWIAVGAMATIAGLIAIQALKCKRKVRKRELRLDEDLEATMDASDPIAKY